MSSDGIDLERARFRDYVTQVLAEIEPLIGEMRNTSCMIDAWVPYELGWSPKRAARAILKIDYGDFDTCRRTMFGENYDGSKSRPHSG